MPRTNRLQLDFKLTTTEERAEFLNNYLEQPQFKLRPPTQEELETMGNYLLWGKDPKTGLNAKQDGSVKLKTKHGTWDHDTPPESLEGLFEMPTFNEASLQALDSLAPQKTKQEPFSREEALAKCPDYLVDTFKDLFRRIDELDLAITYWDLAHGRRTKPPRAQLVSKFSTEDQERLRERASHWNQYRYLSRRHQLVEMRREQYTLRDNYSSPINTAAASQLVTVAPTPELDAEIEVLPLGTNNHTQTSQYVFRPWDEIVPANYNESELRLLSDLYWRKQSYKPSSQQLWIDFRDEEHVLRMFQLFFELDDAADSAELESNLPALMDTLNFYIERAELSGLQKDVLDMKLHKIKNEDIARAVNEKWGKSHTLNYVSTIFRQRIIPKICEAARFHERLVSKVFFEEEFKPCTMCGRILLRDAANFTRKARSADGFTARCKKCDKKVRDAKQKGEKDEIV